MSLPCFLFDENVPLVIQSQLEQFNLSTRIYAIGDGSAPEKGTLDPQILSWIEAHDCLLVTNNRATMPTHLRDHIAQGNHIPGIIQLPKRMNIRLILEDLLLIGEVSEPREFQD